MSRKPTQEQQNHGQSKGSQRPRPKQAAQKYAPFVGYLSWSKDEAFKEALEAVPPELAVVLTEVLEAAQEHRLRLTWFFNHDQEAWNVGLTGYLEESTWPGLCLNAINVDAERALRGLHALHFVVFGEDWHYAPDTFRDNW